MDAIERLRELESAGWKLQHNKGTCYVGFQHERGGAKDLVEVKAGGGSGSLLNLDEADQIAALITDMLKKKLSEAA